MPTRRCWAAFVVACWASSALAQQPQQTPQIQSEQQPEGGLQNQNSAERQAAEPTKPPPHLPQVSPSFGKPQGQAEANKGTEEGTEFWPPLLGYRLKVTDTLIALFTALLFAATWLLWRATNRLVESAEHTAINQLRAFVFAKGFEQGPNVFTAPTGPYIKEYLFYTPIENFGLSPATDVRAWITSRILPTEQDAEPEFEWDDFNAPAVIGPRGTGQTGYHPIPLDQMIALWENRVEIYIATRIEYRDVFDPSTIHHHEQCVLLGLLRHPADLEPAGSKNVPRVIFRAYGKHNSVA